MKQAESQMGCLMFALLTAFALVFGGLIIWALGQL